MKQEKERVQTMNKQSFIEDRMKLEKVAIRLFDTKPKKPYNQGINELIEQRDQATEALRANVNKIQELNPTAAAQQPKGPVAKPSDSVGSRVENKAKAKPTPKPTPAPKKILLATPVAEAAKATPKVTPKKMGAGKAGLIGAGLTAGAIGAKKLYDDHQEKKVAFIEDRMMLEKIANSAEEKYKAAKKDHQALVQRDFTKNMGTEIGLGIVGGMAGSGVDAVMRHKKGLSPKGGFGVAQLGGTVAGIAAGQSTAKGKEKKKDQKESLNKLNAAKKEWKQSKQAFIEDRMKIEKLANEASRRYYGLTSDGGVKEISDNKELVALREQLDSSRQNARDNAQSGLKQLSQEKQQHEAETRGSAFKGIGIGSAVGAGLGLAINRKYPMKGNMSAATLGGGLIGGGIGGGIGSRREAENNVESMKQFKTNVEPHFEQVKADEEKLMNAMKVEGFNGIQRFTPKTSQ